MPKLIRFTVQETCTYEYELEVPDDFPIDLDAPAPEPVGDIYDPTVLDYLEHYWIHKVPCIDLHLVSVDERDVIDITDLTPPKEHIEPCPDSSSTASDPSSRSSSS